MRQVYASSTSKKDGASATNKVLGKLGTLLCQPPLLLPGDVAKLEHGMNGMPPGLPGQEERNSCKTTTS